MGLMTTFTSLRNRAKDKIAGGKIIRVEAHPIPEHPRPRRSSKRVALVGDAAGYVTKCSGEVSWEAIDRRDGTKEGPPRGVCI